MTAARTKLLIIGGYGTFGGRLVRLLLDETRLDIVVAGRSLQKAQTFVAGLSGAAALTPMAMDRQGDLESALAELRPDIVVDASGPFQTYKERPYRVVEAALAAGCNYLDLADDPGFVRGIVRFDDAARQAGLFLLSGVSSCPALTGAVYRRIARDFAHVESVTGGIAPSPYSGVGPSVIRAIAAYAGQAIDRRSDGGETQAYPFTETRRYTVAPPGSMPLRSLQYSLVDVPDLILLGEMTPAPRSVWFGAAPVPTVYHGAFRGLARAVKRRWIKTLEPIAPAMYFVMKHFSWGEHRGGLFLECAGTDDKGAPLTRSWHLLAEGSVGPMTPTLACLAVVRALLSGSAPKPGARAAHGDLELDDFEPLFERLGVVMGERETPTRADRPLFRRVLGEAWPALPAGVARVHDFSARRRLRGRASVIRGRSLIARLAAMVFRFPVSGEHVPVTVEMTATNGQERWTRDFDGTLFSSTLSEGSGAWSQLVCERFGPFRFGIAPVLDNGRLTFAMRRWSFAGIPMPFALRPQGTTFESERDGRFCFDVEITFPLIGHIVTYRGWLEIQD